MAWSLLKWTCLTVRWHTLVLKVVLKHVFCFIVLCLLEFCKNKWLEVFVGCTLHVYAMLGCVFHLSQEDRIFLSLLMENNALWWDALSCGLVVDSHRMETRGTNDELWKMVLMTNRLDELTRRCTIFDWDNRSLPTLRCDYANMWRNRKHILPTVVHKQVYEDRLGAWCRVQRVA